jgi:aminoglycoside phosphotransferase (APT) family kinase protein
MLALCEDTEVIGSAFYVMEYVEGRAFDDPRLPDVPRAERRNYFKNMARVLAAVHKIDVDAVGLSDYGPAATTIAGRSTAGPASTAPARPSRSRRWTD